MKVPRNKVPLSPKKYLPKKIGAAFIKMKIEKVINNYLYYWSRTLNPTTKKML